MSGLGQASWRGSNPTMNCHLCIYSTTRHENLNAHYLANHDISIVKVEIDNPVDIKVEELIDPIAESGEDVKLSPVGTSCLLCTNIATDTKLCSFCIERLVSKESRMAKVSVEKEVNTSNSKTKKSERRVQREQELQNEVLSHFTPILPKPPSKSGSDINEKKPRFHAKVPSDNELTDDIGSYFPGVKLPWYEGCVYECFHFVAYFWNTPDLIEHVKWIHSNKYKRCRSIKKHILYIKTGFWECTFCLGTKIKRNKSCISGHLLSKHGIASIEAYEKISGEGQPEKFEFIDAAAEVKEEKADDNVQSEKSLWDAINDEASLGANTNANLPRLLTYD